MTAPSPMPSIAPLRDVLAHTRELLDTYEAAGGMSPLDDYDTEARVHPMAEAKYVLACVELMEAGTLGLAVGGRRLRGSLDRLEAMDLGAGTDMACWGLEFDFRDMPGDEPFTITTSLVLDALTRARPYLDGVQGTRCVDLQSRTIAWLLTGVTRVDDGGARFPVYGPRLPTAVYNVGAYWAGSLMRALPDGDPRRAEVASVASVVLDRYVPGVGWGYDATSARMDLVHTGYIGWGLLAALPERAAETSTAALTALLQFSGQTWTDRFDARDLAEVLAEHAPRAGRVTRVAGGMALVGFDTQARAWSVGEALVLLGTLTGVEQVAPFCYRELRALATIVVREYLPEPRYRHAMHIAHGLSTTVRVARQVPAGVSREGETKERA